MNTNQIIKVLSLSLLLALNSCGGGGGGGGDDSSGNDLFNNAQNFVVSEGPSLVAAGDVDGDGITDIVVIGAESVFDGSVSVFLAGGQGELTSYSFNQRLSKDHLDVKDINDDGFADVVNSCNVFLGNGMSVDPSEVHILSNCIATQLVADINGDTIYDIIFQRRTVAPLSETVALLGSSSGLNGQIIPVNLPSQNLLSADLNGDNIVDVVSWNEQSITGWIGNFSGQFIAQPTLTTQGLVLKDMNIGDYNGDGAVDVFAYATGVNVGADLETFLVVFKGQNDGTFGSEFRTLINSESVMKIGVDDFNKDGFDDIATLQLKHDAVWLYLSQGDGTLSSGPRMDVGYNSQSLATADVNNDLLPDILTISYRSVVLPGSIVIPGSGEQLYDTDLLQIFLQK